MIKTYSAKISDFTQADYTHQYSLLDCALKQKIDTKKQPHNKMCSLCGYMLFYRGARELYGKLSPTISFNENGKPLCDFCHFSISHSEDRVVCVLSDEAVGIDIQKIKKIKTRKAYLLFNDAENGYVNSGGKASEQRYTEIFTKKESAIKMLGLTLASGATIDTFSNNFKFQTQISDGFITTLCRKNNDIL